MAYNGFQWDYDTKRNEFSSFKTQEKLYTYIDLPPFSDYQSAEMKRRFRMIHRTVTHAERIRIGCILPRLLDHSDMTAEGLDILRSFYEKLLGFAEKTSVKVGFAPEHAYQEYLLRTLPTEDAERLSGKTLMMYDYLCDANATVRYSLHSTGRLMSVVALDDEKIVPETVDLRPFIEDGRVVWTPEASGNWRIMEFVCETDTKGRTMDLLSYGSSMEMLSRIWDLFRDVLSEHAGETLSVLEYHDVSFDAQNRRTWSQSFNEVFERMYGFDPAPYYPALFRNIGVETEHLRALFFSCRSKMMQEGFLRAAYDFASGKGLSSIGSVTEPKLTVSPWITGDNLLNGAYSPGALLDKAYLYGTNSLKIAAAAAYNFDRDRVSCELYRNYYRASKTIFYNDAMNALSRGANQMMVHIPLLTESEHRTMMRSLLASHWESDFSRYFGRVQAMLAGGSHVADIALLYPIYDLSGKTSFYVSSTNRFEYPKAPATADYMNVINGISTYAGHDLTVLHPETLNERCHVENGTLYLDNERNREAFSILILPAAEIISLESLRKVAEFYDTGGKVIATGMLPSEAYEFRPEENAAALRRRKVNENDKEVVSLVSHIFGKDSFDPHVIRPFFYNSNDRGGEAYFLPFTATAADGTALTKSKLLSDAIHSFELPLDIYIPDMPKLECIGALNSVYPEFEALGLVNSIPGGGMLNHIHKRREGCDIYYFSNTTNDAFESYLLLRGRLRPEEWDPYTGKIRAMSYSYVKFRDTHYTQIPVNLPPSGAILIVSKNERSAEAGDEAEESITAISGL